MSWNVGDDGLELVEVLVLEFKNGVCSFTKNGYRITKKRNETN